MGIEAIVGIIPIHLYLKQLSGRHQLQKATFPHNHTIKLLLEKRHAFQSQLHCLFLDYISSKQQQRIKSSIVDANDHLNGVFLFFNSLNCELHPGFRLIDIFSSCISFHKTNHCSNESKLDKIVFNTLLELNTVLVASDTSIKNNIATSIAYIHSFNSSLKKTLYHTINITSIEAELFVLRCGIN